MKHLVPLLIVLGALTFVSFGCGDGEQDDEEKCPRYSDYQLYPEVGDGETEFELLIQLKKKSVNQTVNRIEAELYHSDGSSAQQTLDLVQSNADPFRFLRAFNGAEVCEEGTCNLYFHVVASHLSGCEKAFDTDIFVVQMPAPADDDDDDAS